MNATSHSNPPVIPGHDDQSDTEQGTVSPTPIHRSSLHKQNGVYTDSTPSIESTSPMTSHTIEQRLQEIEDRYRSLISATDQIVWVTDPTGLRPGDLTAWCAYTGQTEAEVDGSGVMNAIHPDDRPRVSQAWHEAIRARQPYEIEYRLRRHDGVYRMFSSRAVPVSNMDGTLREWVGINVDVTERKRLETHLQESETRFRLMFEQATIGMVFARLPDGKLQQVNQYFCDMVGYMKEELLQQSALYLTHPDDSRRTVEALEQLMRGTTTSYTFEKRYIRKDGSIIWVNITMSTIHDAITSEPHYLAIIQDITERKRIEQEAAIRASEFEAMTAAMTDGLIFVDKQANLVRANPAAQRMFGMNAAPGYQVRTLPGRASLFKVYDEHGHMLDENELPTTRLLRGEVLAGEHMLDVTFHTPDGREVLTSISGSPIYDANGEIVNGVLIARDVTHYRNLERRTHIALEGLLSMAEALVRLPENANDIRTIGKRLSELTCDIMACQRVGLLTVEPGTETVRPIGVAGLSPEQEQAWWHEQEQQQTSLNDDPGNELLARLQNKEVVIIDMTQPPFRDAPNPYDIKIMLIAPLYIGERLTGLLTLDYGTDTHLYTQNEVSLASAVAQLLALVLERQHLLQERAEAQGREVALREANRRMEEFLGIASHELRTPLTTIKANVQLAQKRLRSITAQETLDATLHTKLSSTQDMLTRAERQVSVLNRLVGDLIDISRIQTGKLQVHLREEPTDLMQLIAETVEEFCKAHPDRTITFTSTDDSQHLLVHADPDRIVQVLTNYLSNALKYSSNSQPVDVTLALLPPDASHTDTPSQMVKVAVHDQGPGLPPEEQQRIWECFYQAEGVKVVSGSGVGLGLGLYISETIITRHGGQVGVDSTPGAGSTFWFTLPAIRA